MVGSQVSDVFVVVSLTHHLAEVIPGREGKPQHCTERSGQP